MLRGLNLRARAEYALRVVSSVWSSLRTLRSSLRSLRLESFEFCRYTTLRPECSVFAAVLCVYNVSAWGPSKEELVSQVIPDKYRDLFTKRAFASLATLMPDGSPQVTPVWCDIEGDLVVVNSAKGRQKDKNIRRDPRVSLAIIDPDNPYRYLEIRGRVVEITEQGADAHIDKMAKKYLGVDKYPYRQAGEVRVMFKIQPEHTNVMG